jgi:hypothetical protein
VHQPNQEIRVPAPKELLPPKPPKAKPTDKKAFKKE